MRKLMITSMLIGMLILAACSTAVAETAVAETAVSTADEMSMDDTMTDDDADHDEMDDDGMGHDDDMDAADDHEDMDDDGMGHEEMTESSADEMMTDDDMADDGMDEPMADEPMADDDTAMEPAADAMMLAAWQELPLVNARTGETFTLADFTGKTIFVEPMATWCTNCRRQLNNVKQARADLNSNEIVFIGLSLETNLDAATLAAYANNQGFDWLFAVMTPEILQEMAAEFGQIITSAPSTPHFVVRPDGTFTDLVTGIESSEVISAQLLAVSG